MADEKKAVKKETDAKTGKSESKKVGKKPAKFSPKKVGNAIARFFKDLKGEIKKIVWPGRQMVIKSTGVVLASILVIGAGVWILDYAISGAVTGITKAAENVTTTEAVAEDSAESEETASSDTSEEVEETTEDSTKE